jgi:hypothetical protein
MKPLPVPPAKKFLETSGTKTGIIIISGTATKLWHFPDKKGRNHYRCYEHEIFYYISRRTKKEGGIIISATSIKLLTFPDRHMLRNSASPGSQRGTKVTPNRMLRITNDFLFDLHTPWGSRRVTQCSVDSYLVAQRHFGTWHYMVVKG